MPRTCIRTMGSNYCVRPTATRARKFVATFTLGLMFGFAQPAAASSDLQLDPQLAQHAASLQPGPARLSSVSAAREEMADPGPVLPLAPLVYSETFWTAFADLDLSTLRSAARTDPEARFADAMRVLAAGYYESAVSSLIATSQQTTDVNVAVASQVMLASTLRYQHKWAQLRDLALSSRLSDPDKSITKELEGWGKVFAGAPDEAILFPTGPVVLPLGVTAVGTPTVRVRINGKEYDFWLDTGSSMTVISSEVAARAGIAPFSADTLTVRTFAGSAPVRPAIIEKLVIGTIVISNSPAVIIDESLMFLRASGERGQTRAIAVDGIIGWDTIRHLELTMNFAAGKITFRQPDPNGILNSGERNFAWLGKPLVEVSMKSGEKFHFTLDTGAQASFLNATVLEKTGAATKISPTKVYGIARTGRETSRVVPLLWLNLAGKSLPLQNVIVYGPVPSGLINCDGILGSDIARFGTVHIDATNGVFSVGASDAGEDATE
jgi:hypothetical protein